MSDERPRRAPGVAGEEDAEAELAHGALRGAIAAMAMTGMRVLTVDLGIVDETPPRAIFRQRAPGLLKRVPRDKRRSAIELAHWGYGAIGGMMFGLLPDQLRLRSWAGPVYGLALWASFEAGIAPALGLTQAKKPRPLERVAFAVDHVLYGVVVSELRRRSRR
jgi:hypothetical protein